MAKKFLRFILVLLVGLFILMGSAIYYLDEDLPIGTSGSEADLLATKMEEAINKPGWNKLRWVSWTFPGDKVYVWDKYRQFLLVEWG